MKHTIIFGALFLIAGLTSCGGGQKTDTNQETEKDLSGTIQIDGSSTVYPLTEAVAEEFRAEQSAVKITIGSAGSGAGFKKFARAETDISNASRKIKEEEIELCKTNQVQFHEVIVALDGIAIVVNSQNDWLKELSTEDLKKIWNPESTVKKWSDINPEWPAEDIHLFGPSTAHGTYDFFTEEIVGETGASRSDYNAVSDYNVLVQGVSSDKFALGYVGLSYFEENKDKLKLIPVNNGNGAVLPDIESVKNGNYSPLSRPLYLYISKQAAGREEVKAFVSYYLDAATELATEVGYIPLPEADYENAKKAFATFAEQAKK